MSETDDTDVLLLIPPNFFLVHSSGSDDSLLESSRTVVHRPTSCTAQVLGQLVNQVYSLESRLDSIVLNDSVSTFRSISQHNTLDSTESLESKNLDRKSFTFPRRRRRKTKREKRRDLSLTSLDSASARRHIPLLKLTETPKTSEVNDTRSMDGDLSSIVSTPSKNNDKLFLNEIDEFLTKVEAYECPESKYKDRHTASPDSVLKATSLYLSQKLESSRNDDNEIKLPSGRVVSSNVLDKYIYLVKSNPPSTSQSDKSVPSGHNNQYNNEAHDQCSTDANIKSTEVSKPQEIKCPSIRRLNFSEKDVQPTSTPKKHNSYLETFRPSSNKIYDRATKVLEQYKSQSYNRNAQSTAESYTTSPKKEEFKMPQMKPYGLDNREGIKLAAMQNKLLDTIDTDLLSLSELWGERGERDRVERTDSLRLEEERLKREHCEVVIQQLQRNILQQQEKLAVAMRVDKAKDAAICKLREAWIKLTSNLDKAEERHRSALDKMMSEVDNFRMVADDSQKKTNHFEAELYKALDLAHDYQDKCKQLTADKKEMEDKMEKALVHTQEVIISKDKEISVLKENYETVMRLNKQSTDCVKNLEDALEKEKSEHKETCTKASELSRKMQIVNDETTLLAQERDLLKEKVNEERARCNMLERQLCDKQNQSSELLRKCDTLDTEVKALRKHIELQKNELKAHYQKQLEDAVLAKLHEFQAQLDHAEREMENNARSKDNVIVDTYNKQILRIEEQYVLNWHKLEVNVLEEKQREEIKLYRLQLAQASEKIGLLESKLDAFRRRRGQLAAQLHGVMQAQWRQALALLTAAAPDHTRSDSVSTAVGQDSAAKVPSLGLERLHSADKMFSFEGLSDHELQHYVKLLLTKPAQLDGSGDGAAEPRAAPDEPTSDRPERRDRARRALNSSKPPWKA